jgi:hypothetical protein
MTTCGSARNAEDYASGVEDMCTNSETMKA